jgi:hypothetical protein
LVELLEAELLEKEVTLLESTKQNQTTERKCVSTEIDEVKEHLISCVGHFSLVHKEHLQSHAGPSQSTS